MENPTEADAGPEACFEGPGERREMKSPWFGAVLAAGASRTTLVPDVLHTLEGREVIQGVRSRRETR